MLETFQGKQKALVGYPNRAFFWLGRYFESRLTESFGAARGEANTSSDLGLGGVRRSDGAGS